ncbi:CC124 protein, partial [Prunella himalayana]|nr:CC124 protein [Prunella himalayana]
MPKKFQGENSKSAAARARRAEAKAAAEARRQQELEDELWKDKDKHVLRKEQRKVGAPKILGVRGEGFGNEGGKAFPVFPAVEKEKEKSHLELPLEENVNRRLPEEGAVEARSIEDAIAAL